MHLASNIKEISMFSILKKLVAVGVPQGDRVDPDYERRERLLQKQKTLSRQMKLAGTHLLVGHKYSRNTTHLERKHP